MGRPAINTVFNAVAADKEAFNHTAPVNQPTAMGGKFRNNMIATLDIDGDKAEAFFEQPRTAATLVERARVRLTP